MNTTVRAPKSGIRRCMRRKNLTAEQFATVYSSPPNLAIPSSPSGLKLETLDSFLAERLFRSLRRPFGDGQCVGRGDQLEYLLGFVTDLLAKGPVTDLAVRKVAEHAAERDL